MLIQLFPIGCLRLTTVVFCALLIGCVDHSAPPTSDIAVATNYTKTAVSQDQSTPERTDKHRSSIAIDYQMPAIATIDEPLRITLHFGAKAQTGEFEVHYASSSPHSLALHPSQPETVRFEADVTGNYAPQTVMLLPQENGRFYLQISAGLHTHNGLLMRPYSIPVQVGPSLTENSSQKASNNDGIEQGISIPARMD